jgi:hypothetical protein
MPTSAAKTKLLPMDRDAIDRARIRLANAGDGGLEDSALEALLERTQAGLEALAVTTAELEVGMPERLDTAIKQGLRDEVLPVARHLAEVRGLSAQTIRRLERLQGDLAAERKARVEDLALLVELISTGWRGVERRLDRLERVLDRLERTLEQQPTAAPVYRIDRKPGA